MPGEAANDKCHPARPPHVDVITAVWNATNPLGRFDCCALGCHEVIVHVYSVMAA